MGVVRWARLVTRRSETFPLRHDRLDVVGADVLDPAAVDAAVAGRDVVLSALGVPPGKEPIRTCRRQIHRTCRPRRRHARRAGGQPLPPDHRGSHHHHGHPHSSPVDPPRSIGRALYTRRHRP
ncbi:MAG: NAD(P)H-binding protein [Nocardia sp.]|nr:NAD(P)H-binding protein [Nocardia sp.]NUS94491.1 NAD(P)H-binding protein [Nocardia sp.]